MTAPLPMLHLLCGKPASGKSTLAEALSREKNTVLLSEDVWLRALYGDEMSTLSDYARCSRKLRAVVGAHVVDLLRSGVSVVLDFHANTVEARAWMRGLVDASGAAHKLHVLETPDPVCLDRLATRNAKGDHPFTVTEAQFERVAAHFVAPTPKEGFNVVRYKPGSGAGTGTE